MGLFYGDIPILSLQVGTQQVVAVYVGSTRIWPTDVITGLRISQTGLQRITQVGIERVTEGFVGVAPPTNLIATTVDHQQIDVSWQN